MFALGLDAWLAPLRLALDGLGVHGLASLLPETLNPYLEVSSFGVLLSAPHLMLGLALTLACAPLYLRAISGGRIWLVLLGLGAGAGFPACGIASTAVGTSARAAAAVRMVRMRTPSQTPSRPRAFHYLSRSVMMS